MRWQCRRILHQTEVFGAKCVDTYQNVTIDAKCVDRWHMFFVTFCDDSIKKILTWKIVSWFESWHNGHIYVRN